MSRTLRAARSERANALITALLVMTLLMTFGIALLSQVDVQQRETGRERARDSSFQLSEGVLNAQIFQLSARWPESNATGIPYPSACTQTSSNTDCPNTSLTQTYNNVDQKKGETWVTQVRDNDLSHPDFYSDALLSGPSYDANDDGYLWVRSTAVVNGRRRTLVALIKAELTTLNFPRHTLVAGYFSTANQGNKVIIDNNGLLDQYPPSELIVRCTFPTGAPPATGCADYEAGKGQVSPERVISDPAQPAATTPESLDSLRNAAKADGNYYASGCAPSLQGDVPGEVVFMENASGCIYNGNNDYNTQAKPGFVVIAKGQVTINGDATFYGLIYHANVDNAAGVIVNLNGNVSINGSIVVDGKGGISAGSSKVNLVWDPNIFNSLKAFGTAAIVQNTFREITASS